MHSRGEGRGVAEGGVNCSSGANLIDALSGADEQLRQLWQLWQPWQAGVAASAARVATLCAVLQV